MKLFLIRHGLTEDAENGLSQVWGSKLSKKGISDLIFLKKNIYDKIDFDVIYFSPMDMAK